MVEFGEMDKLFLPVTPREPMMDIPCLTGSMGKIMRMSLVHLFSIEKSHIYSEAGIGPE
jgi:hypothetical protein